MTGNLEIIIVLIIAGLALIVMGLGGRLGRFKPLYLIKGIPGIYPSGYIYAFIVIGVSSLLLAFAMLSLSRRSIQDIVIYGLSTLLLVSIILMIWKPRWLKPWWLRWLEDHYGYVLEEILEEARKTNDFDRRIQTEADLAVWANSVAKKYGWQRQR